MKRNLLLNEPSKLPGLLARSEVAKTPLRVKLGQKLEALSHLRRKT